MKKERRKNSGRRFGRRGALRGLAGLGVGTLVGCALPEASAVAGSSSSALSEQKRVAIIGAGMGGVAAAYFMDGAYDVDLFEARSKIGGNCDSPTVQYKGVPVTVDLGAQFFTPGTHPIYLTLLEELDLYDPARPEVDAVAEAAGSLTVFPMDGGWPVLASPAPLLTPKYLVELAIFTSAARQAVLGNLAWEVRLGDWINALPVTEAFRAEVIRPWTSALIGAMPEKALRASARSLLQTFALAFPENPFQGAATFNSKIGLQGNVQRLLDRSAAVNVHLETPIEALSRENGRWTVTTDKGREGPYDAVIVNAPAHASKQMLRGEPAVSDLVGLLDQFEYFDARIVIHTDASYVHPSKLFRATYNLGVDGAAAEGSVWLGPFHDKLPNGKQVEVFKSWAMHRRADPQNILYERRFVHPLFTPESLPAIREVAALQGRDGLFFSGAHYNTFDLQESAVYGGMQVARMLSPDSQTLAALDKRLEARGRGGISYDV